MTDLTQQVDALFTERDEPGMPGCAVGIIQNGEFVYKRGYGYANLDHDIHITPTTVFYLASIAKQFAAMAIALLVEDGRIKLDDDIRKYVPEFPDYGTPIRISHLVHHTSGLRDYHELRGIGGYSAADTWSEAHVVDFIMQQKQLNFKPGDEYLYSNAGYVMMSHVIRRVTGQSLRQFADENIFQPLGMTRSVYRDDHMMVIKGLGYGYQPRGERGYGKTYRNLETVGDGGMFSCVEDLYLWDQTFYDNKLGKGSQSLIDLVYSTEPLNDGTPQPYAFGLRWNEYRGLKTVGHGGGFTGIKTHIMRFPEQRFTAIVLSNLDNYVPEKMAKRITDIYLADQLQPVETPDVKLSEDALKRKVGLYRNPSSGSTRRVALENDQLVVPMGPGMTLELEPVSEERFQITDYSITMEFEAGAAQLREMPNNDFWTVYERVDAVSPTEAELKEYTGRYYCEDVDAYHRAAVQDGKLVLLRKRAPEIPLAPTVKDGFSGPGFDLVFSRDAAGKISGYTYQGSRVYHLRFDRVN